MPNKTNAFPLLPILFLIFTIAKLTNHIDWSWWWVTAPLWGPFAFLFVVVLPIVLLVKWLTYRV